MISFMIVDINPDLLSQLVSNFEEVDIKILEDLQYIYQKLKWSEDW